MKQIEEHWVFIQKFKGKIIDVMIFGSLKELYNQKNYIIFEDDKSGSYSKLWSQANCSLKNIKEKNFLEKENFLIKKIVLQRAKMKNKQ